MPKLLYCALFIFLTTLLACSGPETSPSPTAVAPDSGPGPGGRRNTSSGGSAGRNHCSGRSAGRNHRSGRRAGASRKSNPGRRSNHSSSRRADAGADRRTTGNNSRVPGMPKPNAGMNGTGSLISQLSDNEQSCLSENGDPQQLLTLINSPGLASPEEEENIGRMPGE